MKLDLSTYYIYASQIYSVDKRNKDPKTNVVNYNVI